MDFALSPEQTALRQEVRQYCQETYSFESRMALLESPEGFSREHWKTFTELGWLGAAIPEDAGGYGGSAVENAIILTELGRSLALEPFLACAVLAGQVLSASGEDGKQLLPLLLNGEEMIVLAHGEPPAAGRIEHVETSAVKAKDGSSVLTGQKSLVLGGPSADKFMVSARLSGDVRDHQGMGLFIVDRNAPGLTRHDYRLIDGTRASDITLKNVRVKNDAQIGGPGAAFPAIEHAIHHTIVGMCATALGAMDSVLWTTRDYLRSREQSGVTLNTFQALQHRMADMLIEVELARSMLYRGLHALAQPDLAMRRKEISACKVQMAHSARFVGANGIQLHGGIGLTDASRIGQHFKQLVVIGALFGSADFHLEQFADLPIVPS